MPEDCFRKIAKSPHPMQTFYILHFKFYICHLEHGMSTGPKFRTIVNGASQGLLDAYLLFKFLLESDVFASFKIQPHVALTSPAQHDNTL